MDVHSLSSVEKASLLGKHFRDVSEWLGAPPGLIAGLLDGDDWSLVIKATALTEAALDAAIVAELGREEVADSISFIPLDNYRYGKSTLAMKLGVIDKNDMLAISQLADLRNRCAHGARRISLRFADLSSEELAKLFTGLWKSSKRRQGAKPATIVAEMINPDDVGFAILFRLAAVWAKCFIASNEASRERTKVEKELAAFRRLAYGDTATDRPDDPHT